MQREVRLHADKTIEGADPNNESTWGFEDGKLVFHYSDGGPSTRFTSVNTVDGRMLLKGQFLGSSASNVITHVLTELDWGITNKKWEFKRIKATNDGTIIEEVVIADSIRLIIDTNTGAKKVDGYTHQNESSWDIDGEILVFILNDPLHTRTTRFTTVATNNDGRMVLTGLFLLESGITHILTEKATYWDSTQPYVSLPI